MRNVPDSTDPALFVAGQLREIVGRLKRRMRQESGNEGLSLSQLAVLGRLYRRGSATTSELARAENVRPQSMGSTVASLQALGLIETRADPDDGRRTLLSLTAPARGRVQARRAARDGWLYRTIGDRLNAREQRTLAQAVELLHRLLDD